MRVAGWAATATFRIGAASSTPLIPALVSYCQACNYPVSLSTFVTPSAVLVCIAASSVRVRPITS